MMPEEITVRAQKMFPNCQKYTKDCRESGMEELMKKFKMANPKIWWLGFPGLEKDIERY